MADILQANISNIFFCLKKLYSVLHFIVCQIHIYMYHIIIDYGGKFRQNSSILFCSFQVYQPDAFAWSESRLRLFDMIRHLPISSMVQIKTWCQITTRPVWKLRFHVFKCKYDAYDIIKFFAASVNWVIEIINYYQQTRSYITHIYVGYALHSIWQWRTGYQLPIRWSTFKLRFLNVRWCVCLVWWRWIFFN